jgi:Carboxypeptidase regulatory-like domain
MSENGFKVDSVRVAAPCHVPWDSMKGDDRERHCESCGLNVFNIAAMTVIEAEEFVTARTGRLCVKLYRRSDGTVITKDCPVGIRAYQRRVGRMAGALLTAVLGFFSISFGQKSDKSVDPSKINIERTIDRAKTNNLSGKVQDPAGAVVPGAKLTLSRTGEKRSEESDTDGNYSFADVPSGKWKLSIKSPGFKEFKLANLEFSSNEQITFDTILYPANDSLVIGLLVDDTPRIDLTSSGATTVITRRQMETIPHEE